MNDYVTTKDIAEQLGMTRNYVTKTLVRRADFPDAKVALSQKTRLWGRDDFNAWLRSQERKAKTN